MIFTLPYPPSVNKYWRRNGGQYFIAPAGRQFRKDAILSVMTTPGSKKIDGRLSVEITLEMPDKRRRDIDNITKSVLDALAHAGVYEDDSQIDRLTVTRSNLKPPGCAIVKIQRIDTHCTGWREAYGDNLRETA